MSLTTCSKPAPTACSAAPRFVEHLPRLDTNVARPDQRPGGVEGDLAGNVDRPTRGHLHHMGVAGRVVQRLWVDEVGRDGLLPGGGIGHATIPICSLGADGDAVYDGAPGQPAWMSQLTDLG